MNCLLLNIRQGYANSLHFKCQLLRHRKTNWFLFHYILNEIELYHFLSSLSSFQLFPVNLTWSPYMSLDSHVNSLFYFDYYHYIHINTCMCVHKYVNTICSVHYIYIYVFMNDHTSLHYKWRASSPREVNYSSPSSHLFSMVLL